MDPESFSSAIYIGTRERCGTFDPTNFPIRRVDKILVCKVNSFLGDYFTATSLMSENSESLVFISSGADSRL
jgi:hypothetical protein